MSDQEEDEGTKSGAENELIIGAEEDNEQQSVDAECEKLLRNTKKQVKQMMEEAVTKKYIHEESSSIICLCVAVDACLSHRLKRRSLGLFKTSSSTALIQKEAKNCKEAQQVMDLVAEEDRRRFEEQRLSQSQSDRSGFKWASNVGVHKRNVWIKCALIEKKLAPIVEHLAKNAFKYYEPEALMSNYLYAQILASLLVGPSALEFSRARIGELFQFEDPSAAELLKRHKLANPIACRANRRAPSPENGPPDLSAATSPASGQRRRPLALKSDPTRGTLITDCHHYSCQEASEHQQLRGYSFLSAQLAPSKTDGCQALWSPSMLHETLHQNTRSSLLYAKNNVLLESQPNQQMAGYLSLHETSSDLILKWIPNQMINGGQVDNNESDAKKSSEPFESSYLDLVVSLSVSRIVLMHCQFGTKTANPDEETLILIEADGVQRKPFKFPKGGLRLFLSCLESGLRPNMYLEPTIRFDPNLDESEQPEEASGSTSSEPSGSRLDLLLRRLPSLKRRPAQPEPPSPAPVPVDSSDCSLAKLTNNYVYRIVSANQSSHWSPKSPPHSAGQQQADNNEQSAQRFRWSLSRLTRFSNRQQVNSQTSGSTSSSSMGFSSFMRYGQTNGSLASFLSHQQLESNGSICCDNNSLSMEQNKEENKSSRELARVEAKLHELKESTSGDVLLTLRTQSIQTLCESMRKQILARAFYGWLAHCRKARIIRVHLRQLIKEKHELIDAQQAESGLTRANWSDLMAKREQLEEQDLCLRANQLVYYGGIESDELRKEVWPYLLDHYKFKDGINERLKRDKLTREAYESCGRDWIKVERVVKQRDHELLAANIAKASKSLRDSQSTLNEADDNNNNNDNKSEVFEVAQELNSLQEQSADETSGTEQLEDNNEDKQRLKKVRDVKSAAKRRRRRRARLESTGSVGSDASITDQFGNNIHRIDKDVQRCDRNFWYFKDTNNLDKLRNIMCSYVWQHLDVGYVQGMCDLAAPFLVIFDDEIFAYSCFSKLMQRMVANFPHGCAMDQHFESLKYLMQVLDPKLFDILQRNGDYTHFYFCYRWLLLDFKRELAYEDVYRVWETIWSARCIVTDQFVVFMALAMVRYYRDIIIDNNMDFTDTIKFFNEMAERHDADKITALARDCIVELLHLINVCG